MWPLGPRPRNSRPNREKAPFRNLQSLTEYQEEPTNSASEASVSGNATVSGTNYQAGVIAYVFVHVVTETKLRWLTTTDDTPSAVAGEVKGPGDDARVEFLSGARPIEIQAKHGLKPQKCIEAFKAIQDGSPEGDTSVVVLAVDSTSSPGIRHDLRRDLDRIRAGRRDDLKDITTQLETTLGSIAGALMKRVHIRPLDIDTQAELGAKHAIELLAEHLEDPSQATAAWHVLEKEANIIAADRSRRDRKALIDSLSTAGIKVRPPRATRTWHDDLRHTKRLLADDEPTVVLALLKRIEAELEHSGLHEAELSYRANQHKAAALTLLGQYNEAIAAATKALDHKPDGVHALVNLANAHELNHNLTAAVAAAEKALSLHPESPIAWLMQLQLSMRHNLPAIAVPPEVSATTEFRKGETRILLYVGDFDRAREIAALLVREGDRSSEALLLWIDSLLSDLDSAVMERETRAIDIERLSTEVLAREASEPDRVIQRALVARSVARRILDRPTEAQEDSERARLIRPDDAAALAELARAKVQSGDEDGALHLLSGSVVEQRPFLRAMRADLLANSGQAELARKDLDAVLQAIPGSSNPDHLRSKVIETALHLGDLTLAERLLAELAPSAIGDTVHRAVMQARIAILKGEFEEAESQYRVAASIDVNGKPDLLAELGSQFLRAKRSKDAVRVLREAQPLSAGAIRLFARALVAENELAEAHSVIEKLAAAGPLPDWAIAFAAEIALRRNDKGLGAQHLEELFAREQVTNDGRLTLVKTLLELEQTERARFHANGLVPNKDLNARERMFLAQLLLQLGEPQTAISEGLRAYREAPQDPDVNRAFCSIVFFSKTAPVEFDQVGPGTHVTLVRDGGSLEYLMFGDSVAQTLPKEISIADAAAAGLTGLKIGDVFYQDKGAWFQKEWRVSEIQSAVKYLANDIISNYSTRFPSASFFAVGFTINPEAPTVSDFQPMIAGTHERERRQQEILDIYETQVMPLAVIASLAGVSTPMLMAELGKPAGKRLLHVEWGDAPGRQASREAARLSTATILTRSALVTAATLSLLPFLTKGRRCIAPRSLRDEIMGELREARDHANTGLSAVSTGPSGLRIDEIEAGAPALVGHQNRLEALLEWLDANVEFLPRPLEAFGDPRLKAEMRDTLGESSNDALELGLFTPGAAIYADDLGLRRISLSLQIQSFSTVSLSQVLAETGAIEGHHRNRLLVDLAERHYATLEVTPDLLVDSFTPGREAESQRRTFWWLAAADLDGPAAAKIVVAAVKMSALQSVKTVGAAAIATLGFEAMAAKFSRPVAALLISRAADADLALLPTEQRIVKAVCIRLRNSRNESKP